MHKKDIIEKFFTSRKEVAKMAGFNLSTIYEIKRGDTVSEQRIDAVLDVIYRICEEVLSCKNK